MSNPRIPFPRLFALLLALHACGAAVFAQGGISLGSSLQNVGSATTGLGSIGGDAVRVPGLGIQGMTPPTTWSTPSLPDQRPLFEPIDENTYIIGPGDHFHVGTGVRFFNLTVGPEGYLVIDGIAPIYVTGLTLKAARALMIEKLSRQYRGDAISVRLSEAKRFQVLVAGSVNRPGMHVLDYGARVSHALDAAGGYTARAARKLVLKRVGGEEIDVDLRRFFLEGDVSRNPLLQQGDRIFADEQEAGGRVVYWSEGSNVTPITYVENETLDEFVVRYDNYRDGRVWTAVRIYDSLGRYETEIPRERAATRRIAPGSTIELRYAKSVIFIGGMVMRPGLLEYNPNLTAMDYLAMAGIIVGTSDVRRIDVLGADGKKRKVNVARDPLLPGDHILVPRSVEATLRDHIAIISAISSLAVAIATFVVLTGG